MNRKSMYADFGSKQELFEAALDRYSEKNLSRVLTPIEAVEADAQTICDALLGYVSAGDTKFLCLACLVANTAAERLALDPGSAKYVDAYLVRLEKGSGTALESAHRDGDVGSKDDLNSLTAHFVSSILGVSALLRASATPEQLLAAGRSATSMLRTRRAAKAL